MVAAPWNLCELKDSRPSTMVFIDNKKLPHHVCGTHYGEMIHIAMQQETQRRMNAAIEQMRKLRSEKLSK